MPNTSLASRGHTAESDAMPVAAEGVRLAMAWSANVLQWFEDAQRVPMQAGLAWQKSLSDVNQEIWDEWAARFAGAAAIDA